MPKFLLASIWLNGTALWVTLGVILTMAEAAPAIAETATNTTSYRLLNQSGFGSYLKLCSEYQSTDDERACISIHNEMTSILQHMFVSRQPDSRLFINFYFDGYFDRLQYCIATTCGGYFVLRGQEKDAMASRWKRIIDFQACVHAAPATWPAESQKSKSFVPQYRFRDASVGRIHGCDPSNLSTLDKEILQSFNLNGQY